MAATSGNIRIAIMGYDAGFGSSLGKAWAQADTFQKKMAVVGKTLTSVGSAMTKYVTVPIVAGMSLAVVAAVKNQEALDLLSQAMKKNMNATDADVAAVDRWLTALSTSTGAAKSQLIPAMAQLERATKNTAESEKLMTVANDIAIARGKPLESVVNAISKAYLGQTAGLGRLGIATKDYSVNQVKLQAAQAALGTATAAYNAVMKKSTSTDVEKAAAAARVATATAAVQKVTAGTTGTLMTFNQIMAKAVQTYGGAAASAAQTTAGKLKILEANVMALAVAFGTLLLPTLEKIVSWLSDLAKRFDSLSPSAKRLIVVVAGLAAAVGPVLMVLGKLATTIAMLMPILSTGASMIGAFGAAFSVGGIGALGASIAAALGPIGLVVAAIVALGAAFLAAYHYIGPFRDLVQTLWADLVAGAKWVAATVGPALKNLWSAILPDLRLVVSAVGNLFSAMKAEIEDVVRFVKEHWNTIGPIVKAAWDASITATKTFFKVLADVINLIAELLKGHWGAAWKDAEKLVSDAMNGIARIVADLGQVAVRALIAVGAAMLRGLSRLPGEFVGIGVALMNGLAHGIESAATGLYHTLEGVAAAVLTLGHHIHFSEGPLYPMGQKLVLGLAHGMSDTGAVAVASAARIAVAIAAALNGALGKNGSASVKRAAAVSGPVGTLLDFVNSITASLATLASSQMPALSASWKADVDKIVGYATQMAVYIAGLLNKAFPYTKGTKKAPSAVGAAGTAAANAAASSGPVGTLLDFLTSTLTNFAALTADSIKLAIVGMHAAAGAAPDFGAAVKTMVGALSAALSGVVVSTDFTTLVTNAATVVGDIGNILTTFSTMTDEAVQNAIYGARWVSVKAKDLGVALKEMVAWLSQALAGIDATSLGALQVALTALSDISSSIANIVSNLASMTSDQLSAASAAGASLGSSFYDGLVSWHDKVVQEAYSLGADAASAALSGASGAGISDAASSAIANAVIVKLGTAVRSTARGMA